MVCAHARGQPTTGSIDLTTSTVRLPLSRTPFQTRSTCSRFLYRDFHCMGTFRGRVSLFSHLLWTSAPAGDIQSEARGPGPNRGELAERRAASGAERPAARGREGRGRPERGGRRRYEAVLDACALRADLEAPATGGDWHLETSPYSDASRVPSPSLCNDVATTSAVVVGSATPEEGEPSGGQGPTRSSTDGLARERA